MDGLPLRSQWPSFLVFLPSSWVMLLGQSRVFYSMATDGLLPRIFSDVHPTFCTPYKCNITLFFFVGVLGGFLPGSLLLGDLTSIGTLFAFVLVSIGIWILRRAQLRFRATVPHAAGAARADPGRDRVQHHDSFAGWLIRNSWRCVGCWSVSGRLFPLRVGATAN